MAIWALPSPPRFYAHVVRERRLFGRVEGAEVLVHLRVPHERLCREQRRESEMRHHVVRTAAERGLGRERSGHRPRACHFVLLFFAFTPLKFDGLLFWTLHCLHTRILLPIVAPQLWHVFTWAKPSTDASAISAATRATSSLSKFIVRYVSRPGGGVEVVERGGCEWVKRDVWRTDVARGGTTRAYAQAERFARTYEVLHAGVEGARGRLGGREGADAEVLRA